ncbi:MAG TPA: hypothetical protein VHR86_09130 [Armatimonadota bacterium]|nr:hypothetical protein [Armatimonadota bacterium]
MKNRVVIEVPEILAGKPEDLSRQIAAAFYRELRHNGLSSVDIITVASELLRCLNETLAEYQGKVER